MVGTLFPFVSEAPPGRREGDRLRPTHYGGESSWRDGGSTWQVSFASDGRATAVEVPASERCRARAGAGGTAGGTRPGIASALTAIAAARPGTRLNGPQLRRPPRDRLRACLRRDGTCRPRDELACAVVRSELLAGGLRSWRRYRAGARRTAEPVQVWLRRGRAGAGLLAGPARGGVRFGTVTVRLIGIDRPRREPVRVARCCPGDSGTDAHGCSATEGASPWPALLEPCTVPS